jgi:hypothetical protein
MGGKYSTELAGATERQKERYGVFSLGGKQKQSLIILEQLLQELLTSNNKIFSLLKLIQEGNKPENTAQIKMRACKDLFIVLSTSLQKEFQVLKFPDPVRPSETAEVAYIPTETYMSALGGDSKRQTLCNNIAWFMVRLITVLFGLISSVKFDYSKNISLLASDEGQVNTPIVSFITNPLVFDLFGSIDSVGSYRGNLLFIGSDKVLIDKDQGIVFTSNKNSSGVAAIKIQNYEEKKATFFQPQYASDPRKTFMVTLYPCFLKQNRCIGFQTSVDAAVNSVSAGPVPPVNAIPIPIPIPNRAMPMNINSYNNGSNAMSIMSGATHSSVPTPRLFSSQQGGRRKTRRAHRTRRRKTYKYHAAGGNFMSAFTFILRQDGMTKLIGEQEFTQSFSERVSKFLDTIPMDEKFKPGTNPYIPLDGVSTEVLERVKLIYEALKAKDPKEVQTAGDVYSPAQFRAYLLASQTRKTTQSQLLTSFCEDAWRGSRVTDVLSYAMLDALFKDMTDNKSTPVTQMEYKAMLDQFVSHNLMKPSENASGFQSFHDLVFAKLPDELLTFCSQTEKAIDNPLYIELLMHAHKQLRDLYDTHLQAVISFITSKIIAPKARGFKKVEWVLNPAFSTDSRGATIVLESFIQEARKLLVKHYFAVESVYADTIDKMKTIGLGIVPTNSVVLAKSVEK